uniref:Uncharacterized protein n=1 Tax=Ditylenchus dipsaci TaxID=166011 RepID=A0A915D0P0_9BILA
MNTTTIILPDQSLDEILASPLLRIFGATSYAMFSSYASTYLPLVMLMSYLSIFIYIRCFMSDLPREHGRQPKQAFERPAEERYQKIRRRRELSFLIQSALICGFLELQNLFFAAMPYIKLDSQWSFLINFLENWTSILLNT